MSDDVESDFDGGGPIAGMMVALGGVGVLAGVVYVLVRLLS